MAFELETAHSRKDQLEIDASPLQGPTSAPAVPSPRVLERSNYPTRASTVSSTHDLNRNHASSKHDLAAHAHSEDLNHTMVKYDPATMAGSLPMPSPAFRSGSRPTTPGGSSPQASIAGAVFEPRGRRTSTTSQSSSISNTSNSSSPTKAGATSVSSSTSANMASSTCAACGGSMTGAFVRALGTMFHLQCFKCMDCGEVVASKFFPIDGPDGKQQPLCERDYFRRLNLICAKCGQALRGSYITACNKKYHVEHFTCSLCSTLFGPQDSYYEHDGDVYCHFHYSTRFATKCAGCSSAILKQFVEINRNNRDECWHPECYMINKFWNVKVVSRRQSTVLPDGAEVEPPYVEDEKRETAVTLKDKQVRMEQLVYRIWTVLSAYEESSAACISDMLRQVSNGQYLDAIRMAEKFILHVEVLFGTIDDLEYHSARLNLKGMSHVREARMLCRKTVDLFTLLSRTQETGSRRMGMTQELLALVTGIAHYLKILIRIALTGALKLEREQSVRDAMPSFLDKLHLLAVQGGDPAARRIIRSGHGEVVGVGRTSNSGTQGVTYGYKSLAPELAGESPFSSASPPRLSVNNPPSDRCIKCTQAVEEDCARLGTYQRWHSHCLQCSACGKPAAVKEPPPPKLTPEEKEKMKEQGESVPKPSSSRKQPPIVDDYLYDVDKMTDSASFGKIPTLILCTEHAHQGCRSGFQAVSRLEQYAFLLNIALRRLYLVLKQQGVVPLSPVASTATNTSQRADEDPYRNSGDIMRMKSVHLDRKLSATARLPKRSMVIESPAGRTVHPTDAAVQRSAPAPQEVRAPQPQRAAVPGQLVPGRHAQQMAVGPAPTSSQPPSRAQIRSPGMLDTTSVGQVLRPSFARSNTEVKIVEESAPNSPAGQYEEGPPLRAADDGITLADIPQLMEAAQAREQQRSLPRQSTIPHIAELSALELAIVKYSAVLALQRSPLKDLFDLDEILDLIETKRPGFWKQLFKSGDKKNVKKKGTFNMPLELLVEREGADSLLGATRATLRVPSFVDDVVSAMRQMDMSVEGIFRRNGNIRRLKDLADAIDHDPSSVDLSQDNPVQLAALLKKFLREMPEPLLTFKLHRLLIASQSSQIVLQEEERLRLLHLVSILLPKAHRDTMEVIFVFLKWVASFSHLDESTGSKMDLPNLATVICPSILYARGRDAVRDESFGAIRVVTSLLENQDEFYTVPEEFLPILNDQDYFASSMDMPSKDFLKKCDTYMRLKASGRTPTAGFANPPGATSPKLPPQPDRPILVTAPSEPQIRNGRQQSPHPHPGAVHAPMSYPSPNNSASFSQNAAFIHGQQQQQQQLRSPHPIEGDWTTVQPPWPDTNSSNSSPRPASYVPARLSGEHSAPPSVNGHQPRP
ncbi:RhoGAP-domain-containing protein [Coniophora puteana RWD-64-598 SS2]|uniref:RhoGAP-domain-containing protein n=1 Tax=Coniophora puteana (strain RWD-64-598) TaxID=741705 RepID=A0A5M3MJZ8_CONPW|nr:RhoGAP-domain-containing protein [Coniophora puteana RWD-64-598 SS2]EIW79260.1 RhoGAP-domain-containing protein [Coniophora puteana RWD-64-598 SS2]